MNFIMGMLFGATFGMGITIVVTCVGGSNHEEESYKNGYDRGYADGMREARMIWSGREREE